MPISGLGMMGMLSGCSSNMLRHFALELLKREDPIELSYLIPYLDERHAKAIKVLYAGTPQAPILSSDTQFVPKIENVHYQDNTEKRRRALLALRRVSRPSSARAWARQWRRYFTVLALESMAYRLLDSRCPHALDRALAAMLGVGMYHLQTRRAVDEAVAARAA